MSKELALANASALAPAIEKALVMGDLKDMKPEERVMFYNAVCQSVGLNPLTRPLEYIVLNGRLTLYARKDCTEQLRRRDSIAIKILSREVVEDCYIVTAQAMAPDGRQDESIGAVPIMGLKGEAKANAIMKAETKAKRRVTLSICGLGILDESEVERRPRRGPAWHFEDPPAQLTDGLQSEQVGGNGNPAGSEGVKGPASQTQAPVTSHGLPAGDEPVCGPCSNDTNEAMMTFVPAGKTDGGREYEAFWQCPNKVKGHVGVKHADHVAKLTQIQNAVTG